jgi:polysaccharide biosynthesis protein VpsJ
VTTCYVSRALFALGELLGDEALRNVALSSVRFISKHLYTEADGSAFYAYIPGERAFVHNASLWGSAWAAQVGAIVSDSKLVGQALDVARTSAREQGEDGSWIYGTRSHHRFIDGFHTGFNLEALCIVREALGTSEFDDCIARGYTYYKRELISRDGVAKYYASNPYPLDMHSFAQAMLTLLKVGGTADDLVLCRRVVASALRLLYSDRTGKFAYQRSKWFTNSIDYSRWTQAWAYYALAFFNRFESENPGAPN